MPTTSLIPRAPYDFNLTAAHITRFRGQYGAESFRDGVLRRLLELDGPPSLFEIRSTGTVDSPRLDVELIGGVSDDTTFSLARKKVAWLLGTDEDLAPFYRLAEDDAALHPLVHDLRGLHIPHIPTVYEALVGAILGQQISAQVARVLRTLLIETYGDAVEIAGVKYYTFPRPAALVNAGTAGLRAIKLSGRKAEYIVDIARQIASGGLDLEGLHKLADADIVARLTEVRGVGRWTAEWLLVNALGRPDGFPHTDLALVRVLSALVNSGVPLTPEAALDYSRRWSPYRSYVTTYIFAALRSGRLDRLLKR